MDETGLIGGNYQVMIYVGKEWPISKRNGQKGEVKMKEKN